MVPQFAAPFSTAAVCQVDLAAHVPAKKENGFVKMTGTVSLTVSKMLCPAVSMTYSNYFNKQSDYLQSGSDPERGCKDDISTIAHSASEVDPYSRKKLNYL